LRSIFVWFSVHNRFLQESRRRASGLFRSVFGRARNGEHPKKKNKCRRFGWSELHARLNCTERFKYSGGVHAVSSDYTHRSFSAAMTLKFVIIARCALRAVLNIEKM
jgi:hypothetical protein